MLTADRVLVTGGSGYFGSLLAAELLHRANQVRVLDVNDNDDRPGEIELIQADVRDPEAVAVACAGVDVVYHNVAQVPLARDSKLFESVNVGGTNTLLTACESAGVRKVVYTSSSAVFGVPKSNPVYPDTPPTPVEPYGRAKYAGELLCEAARTRGLDVAIIRPRTIMGHGRLGIFGILFDWIADGVAVPVLGKGDNRYQFVHAADLAAGCILAGERPGSGTYNVGAAQFGTMRETLQQLCEYAGTGARVRSLPVGLTSGAMQATAKLGLTPFAPYHWIMYSKSLWFDTTAANKELGWSAKYSTDAMFRESYDWFLAHRRDASPATRSHHQTTAKQGLLRLAKKVL
jgi:nucleoside-diphosphate-sugar epimerase